MTAPKTLSLVLISLCATRLQAIRLQAKRNANPEHIKAVDGERDKGGDGEDNQNTDHIEEPDEEQSSLSELSVNTSAEGHSDQQSFKFGCTTSKPPDEILTLLPDAVCIGEGAWNRVYRGKSLPRIIKYQYRRRSDSGAELYAECAYARHIAASKHPGTKHIMDCLSTNADQVILTKKGFPYVELSDAGDPMFEAILNLPLGELTAELVGKLFGQLLLALDALASLGFSHGDLWADNVCLQEEEGSGFSLSVIDLGRVNEWMADDMRQAGVLLCVMTLVPRCGDRKDPFNNDCVLTCASVLEAALRAGGKGVANAALNAMPDDESSAFAAKFVERPALWEGLVANVPLRAWLDLLYFGSRSTSSRDWLREDQWRAWLQVDLRDLPNVRSYGGSCEDAQDFCDSVRAARPNAERVHASICEHIDGRKVNNCQQKSKYMFHMDNHGWMGLARDRYTLHEWIPKVSSVYWDAHLLCLDAQVSLSSCAEWAGQLEPRPKVTSWQLTPDTIAWPTCLAEFDISCIFRCVQSKECLAIQGDQSQGGPISVSTRCDHEGMFRKCPISKSSTIDAAKKSWWPKKCGLITNRDCGHLGINESGCVAKGCCWLPTNPNPINLPWCFYPGSPGLPKECAEILRKECGTSSITSF